MALVLCCLGAAQASGGNSSLADLQAEIDAPRAAGDFLAASYAAHRLAVYHRRQGRPELESAVWESHIAFLLQTESSQLASTDRQDLLWWEVLAMLSLRNSLEVQARLGQAAVAQGQAEEKALQLIARAVPGSTFSFARPVPLPATFPIHYAGTIFWLRTQRAQLLELQGDTLAAVALLRQNLADLSTLGNQEDLPVERGRTRNNLAVCLAFLGYEQEGIALYREIAEARDEEGVTVHARSLARLNLARAESRFSGPTEALLARARDAAETIRTTDSGRSSLLSAREIVARMESALGRRTEAEAILRDLQKQASQENQALIQLYARRTLLFEQMDDESGKTTDRDFTDLLTQYHGRGLQRGEPSLYREYAEFLIKQHRFGEAIHILRQALTMTQRFGWDFHVPHLLLRLAACYEDLGDRDRAAAIWQEIDQFLRAHPDLPARRQLEAMVGKILWRKWLGDLAGARKLYGDATHFALTSGLPDYQKQALLAIQLDLDSTSPAPTPVPAAVAAVTVDLQPVSMLSRVTPGETLRGRFTLSNFSNQPAPGVLSVRGAVRTQEWDAATGTWQLHLDSAQADKVSSPSGLLSISPGEQVVVTLDLPTGSGKPTHGEANVQWQPAEASLPAARGVWKYETSPDRQRLAVTQASVARRNAFYAIPLFHEILRRGAGRSARNFRVVCSKPCRVEIVSSPSGRALAVDAEGNGSFADPGDQLMEDRNHDGFPDFVIPAETESVSLEFLLTPAESSAGNIHLELQLQTASGWETYAVDELE